MLRFKSLNLIIVVLINLWWLSTYPVLNLVNLVTLLQEIAKWLTDFWSYTIICMFYIPVSKVLHVGRFFTIFTYIPLFKIYF